MSRSDASMRALRRRRVTERAPARPVVARYRRSRCDHRGRLRRSGHELPGSRRSRPARLGAVLDQAIAWKADPDRVPAVLAGHGIAALFEKPSARTRISIEMAVATLGGHPIYIRPEEVGLDSRESVEDVAAGRHVHDDRGSCLRPPHARAHGGRGRRPDRESALRSRPALADLLTLREHFGGSKASGSPTRVTATTSPRRSRSARRCRGGAGGGLARGVRQLDPEVVARLATSEARSDDRRSLLRGPWRRRDLHRRRTSMGQEAEPRGRVRWGSRSTMRCCRGASAGGGVCIACPRTGARRSRPRGPCSLGWPQASNRRHSRAARAPPGGCDLMATLGKPQRQHRIAARARRPAGVEPGPAARGGRGRGHPGRSVRDLEELARRRCASRGAMAYAIPDCRPERAPSDDHLKRLLGEFVAAFQRQPRRVAHATRQRAGGGVWRSHWLARHARDRRR